MLRAYGGCLGCKRRRRTWQSCEKPRGAAKQAVIRGSPNGETQPYVGYLVARQEAIPREVKNLSTWRKRNQRDSLSSASEKGGAQTVLRNGVVGRSINLSPNLAEHSWKARP